MKRIQYILTLVFALSATTLYAQTLTLQSYNQARDILDKAIIAYGGLENLRSIQNFSVKLAGDSVHRNQSRRTGMSERTPYQYELVVDLKRNRMFQTNKGGYPGGFEYNSSFSVDKTDGVAFDLIRKTTSARPNVPPATVRARLRILPQLMLFNAVDRASRLRYLGRADFDKRPHDVISYSNEDGAEIAFYIHQQSRLVSKFETLGTDAFSGDVVTEVIFTGYRDIKGQKVPISRITKVGGEVVEEVRYEDAVFNAALSDDKFKAPADFRAVTFPTPEPVTKLADNVYTVSAGGYNVLFVAFKDFVFVMEAPGGDGVSKQAIEQIKKTVPGKPIRYLAVTHHHDDHAGGIRTYIAEGATLIAAPGEKTFFEKIARSRFTVSPDALALKPQPIKIETLQYGKRVITDGTQTVEIHDIGSGPHTEEMLVAYLPEQRILFQGDLLNRPSNGDYPIANDTTVHFAKWIETKRLAVDKIAAVHGPVSTMEELRKAVAEKEKSRE